MAEINHPILGIDFGEARIGVAATDSLGIMVHPVETIQVAQNEPIARICQIATARSIQRIIVGLPVRLDGTEGRASAKVRQFAEKLQQAMPGLLLEFSDEFLSTSVAQEKLRHAGKRAKQQKNIIDQAAAVEILESWLARNADCKS